MRGATCAPVHTAPVHTAYVGLGSNLDDPAAQLRRAFGALAALPATRLLARSSLYASAPLGFTGQPDFVNAAARLETALSPEALLAELVQIERRQSRTRTFRNAPRTLDLDLLLYADRVLERPGLSLPHPRLQARAFVLLPLLELDPGLVIPGAGPAVGLLAACLGQRVSRLCDAPAAARA